MVVQMILAGTVLTLKSTGRTRGECPHGPSLRLTHSASRLSAYMSGFRIIEVESVEERATHPWSFDDMLLFHES